MLLTFETVLSIAIFFAVFAFVRRTRSKQTNWTFLAAGSFLLFGFWWSWQIVAVLLCVATISFAGGLAIDRWSSFRGWFAAVGFLAVAGILFGSHYLDPLHAQRLIGGSAAVIGVSFYGLQAMSYIVDVYRGDLRAVHHPVKYLAYLALFPKLIGPIVRAKDMLVELEREPRPSTSEERWQGLVLITRGLALKALAGAAAASIFVSYEKAILPSGPAMWLIAGVIIMYYYCDLKGYCDIASGLCRWMGLSIAADFGRPFGAASFRDFWARWYISATSWFSDYIGRPISSVVPGPLGRYLATVAAFTAYGWWLGPTLSHVVWGSACGILVVFESITRWDQWCAKLPGGRLIAGFIVTVIFVALAPFLYYPDLGFSLAVFKAMLVWEDLTPIFVEGMRTIRDPLLYLVVLCSILVYLTPRRFVRRISESTWGYRLAPLGIALLLTASIFVRGQKDLWSFVFLQF